MKKFSRLRVGILRGFFDKQRAELAWPRPRALCFI